MRLADIKVGERYAVLRWRKFEATELRRGEWDREVLRQICETARCVEVVEKGVQVSHYARPGVLVRHLDRDTGEPTTRESWGKGEDRMAPEPLRAVQVLMEWDTLQALYLDSLETFESEQIKAAAAREAYKKEAQERAAREWMERAFEAARSDLEDVQKLGAIESFDDDDVRRLVDQRFPEGNPYLNGEREAH